MEDRIDVKKNQPSTQDLGRGRPGLGILGVGSENISRMGTNLGPLEQNYFLGKLVCRTRSLTPSRSQTPLVPA